MNNDGIPKPGDIYKHFKNKLYQIFTVATHTETGDKMVVYQALYGDFKTYVRPLETFISEVDNLKYPNVQQKYRFELVIKDDYKHEINIEQEDEIEQEAKIEQVDKIEQVNPILLDFLDAKLYEDKLAILSINKKDIDDRLINVMAASMDCTVEEGNIEDRIRGLMFCLQTFARFESNR